MSDSSIVHTKWKKLLRGDRPLWVVIVTLYVVSLLVIYSSTASIAYKNSGGNTTHYFISQLLFLLCGFTLTVIVHRIKPRVYLPLSKYLLYGSIALTLLAYTPFFGSTLNGASRWFEIPGSTVSFQPSEILKIALVLYLAVKLGARQNTISSRRILPSFYPSEWRRNPQENMDILYYETAPLILPIIISMMCVFPSNLSTALIIFAIGFVMLMFGRVRRRELARLLSIFIIGVVLIISVMSLTNSGRASTWMGRLESFVAPIVGVMDEQNVNHQDEFQKTQARIAIASGGVIGKGPGNSTQRSQLPHPYSDFAYAFIIEEYGLVGGLVVLFLYLWMLFRAGMIIRKCSNPIYALVVVGLTFVIIISAFVNMAVSVGAFPITGQPLPIISKGGTSLLFTSVSLGIILGISHNADKEREKKRKLAAINSTENPPLIDAENEVEAEEYQEERETPTNNENKTITPRQWSKSSTIVQNEDFEFEVRDAGVEEERNKNDEREVVSLDDWD